MHVIHARNINSALVSGLRLVHDHGVARPSRNGPVLEVPDPVTTVYLHPRERVLFSPVRNANPFYHLSDGLWLLGGRDDVASLAVYNARVREYSDDGIRFHGAYGARIAGQVPALLRLLRNYPDTRRAALAIWRSELDLGVDSKDIPCNNMIWFLLRDGRLDMTVGCRSNDALWGAYGANVVQFSMLQEYLACQLGVGVGKYRQVSNNLHVYTEGLAGEQWRALMREGPLSWDAYSNDGVQKFPSAHPCDMGCEHPAWHSDLVRYLETRGYAQYTTAFFTQVAGPMQDSWLLYKSTRDGLPAAIDVLTSAVQTHGRIDWLVAGLAWFTRILERRNAKQ